MDLRGHSDWAIFVLQIWVNLFSSVLAGFHDSNAIVQSLDCTNDFIDMISCEMDAPNCTQYKLLFVEENKEMHCKQCADGQCCCSLNPQKKILLIYGENHRVTVWKGGENLGTETISIIAGIKPRVPKIISVKNSNGIFEIRWKSNMEEHYIDTRLNASVTYFKEGETKKTSPLFMPTSQDDLKVYRIPSQDLEPSTSYRVCVRSYFNDSGRYSDCSAEASFTTPMSRSTLALVVILSLSVAAVLLSSVAFVCFVKIKTLWWDTVPKPKLLLLNLSEQKILKPALPVLSLVQVEPHRKAWLVESGLTAGDRPSAFTSISPASTGFPQRLSDSGLCSSPSIPADGGTFGSCCFDNKSYFSVSPRFPEQEEGSEVRAQGELICDPAYRGPHGDSDGQQLLEHLLLTSASLPLMDTDICYQVTKADFIQVPRVGDSRSSLSSRSSTLCDSSSGVGLRFDRDAAKIDNSGVTDIFLQEILLDGGAPAGSNGSLPVEFTYQTFQSLVEPSDAPALQKRGGEEQLSGHPDGLFAATSEHSSHPAGSCYPDDVPGGSASPTFQKSFFSLLSADQSTPTIMVDSDYKRVVNADAW